MSPSPAPFLVTVWDKAFNRRGFVGNYDNLNVTPRHNAIPTASLTVSGDHPRLAALLADGARLTVDYDINGDGTTWERIISGPVTAPQGTFPSLTNPVVLGVKGDLWLLSTTLGWPVPGSAIGAQGGAAYDVRSGPAETVIKAFVQANMVSRLGLPLTVAPDLGRGATVKLSARMTSLADLLLPVATAAGVGVTITQVDGPGGTGGLVLDCYTPVARSVVIDEDSGILVGGSWTRTTPEATDVVVGGQGDGTARTFRLVRDTALAASLGVRREVFKDATDLDTAADLDARGAQTLREGGAGAGISLQLAETSSFRYGKIVRVGDVVPVRLAVGVTITDVVGSAVLTHDRRTGLTVSPRVGDDTASAQPDRVLARALSRLAGAVAHLNTRR